MSHVKNFLNLSSSIIRNMDFVKIDKIIDSIQKIKKKKGRIFFLGVGGSGANCSHAVNDFRKLCEIEAYSPIDNSAEITARTNDEGWNTVFVEWLKISKLKKNDCIFILSVGGGNKKRNVSMNLVKAIDFANKKGAKILGIVGKKDGYTYKKSDYVCLIPEKNKSLVTPLCEGIQSIILHLIVSDKRIQSIKTKW